MDGLYRESKISIYGPDYDTPYSYEYYYLLYYATVLEIITWLFY